MDKTKPIIKMGMPVVTRPITTTVIISAGLSAECGQNDLIRALRKRTQTRKKPTEIGKKDQGISDEPKTQMA